MINNTGIKYANQPLFKVKNKIRNAYRSKFAIVHSYYEFK